LKKTLNRALWSAKQDQARLKGRKRKIFGGGLHHCLVSVGDTAINEEIQAIRRSENSVRESKRNQETSVKSALPVGPVGPRGLARQNGFDWQSGTPKKYVRGGDEEGGRGRGPSEIENGGGRQEVSCWGFGREFRRSHWEGRRVGASM